MISSSALRKKDFTVVREGYNIDEVNEVLNQAASTIEAYAGESEDMYHKMEVLAEKIEEYRNEEDSIKTALITAQKMADKIKRDSEEKAAALTSESESKAQQTVADANAQAEKIVTQAREYSQKLINDKTQEAQAILLDAQTKANDAVNSSKSLAKDILSQAKEISNDLITKSKEEKEAYDILIAALKNNAAAFISQIKDLYGSQLEALDTVNLDASGKNVDADKSNIESVHSEVENLVSEIDDMDESIPEDVVLVDESDSAPAAEEESEQSDDEDKTPEDDLPEEDTEESSQEDAPEAEEENADETESTEEESDNSDDEPFVLSETGADDDDDDEETDPMAAVEAFSANEITPVDNKPYIPEIDDEAPMEKEESLFNNGEEQPFESYFNIKREENPNDRTETISLVPPEDDDEDDDDDAPKFKGFFKKKK